LPKGQHDVDDEAKGLTTQLL